jgi:hypothetical protein
LLWRAARFLLFGGPMVFGLSSSNKRELCVYLVIREKMF